MGYFVVQENSLSYATLHNKTIRERFHVLNKHDELKDGQSWNGKVTTRHFSWMPKTFDGLTVKDIWENLGFTYEERDGYVFLSEYDSKMGQEDLFLSLIGDILLSHTTSWLGEDGKRSRVNYREAVKNPIIQALIKEAQGKDVPAEVAQSMATPAPKPKTILEFFD